MVLTGAPALQGEAGGAGLVQPWEGMALGRLKAAPQHLQAHYWEDTAGLLVEGHNGRMRVI